MTPLVPLDVFRKEMQINPYHFWGLSNVDVPIDPECDALVREYGWQSPNAVGRDDIRRALEQAETLLREYLGYSIAPKYFTETLHFPRYADKSQHRVGYFGSDGRWLSLRLHESRVIKVGVEKLTLIGTVTGASLVITDTDGDNLSDTFTATIATTVTDPDQIALYFAASDRLDSEPAGDRWRITPVSVSIAGGTATIRGRYWLLVRPVLYQRVNPGALNPATATNFASSLEVHQRRIDPTGTTLTDGQARLIWETAPYPIWATSCGGDSGVSFGDSSTDPAAEAYAIARITLRDAARGIVGVGEAVFNTATSAWEAVSMSLCRPPDRIDVRYQAGEALVGGQVNPRWVQIVSRFAAAILGKRVCECDQVNRELRNWQIDRAFAGSRDDESYSLSPEDLANPFGTRAGAIQAWHAVENLREVRGVLA